MNDKEFYKALLWILIIVIVSCALLVLVSNAFAVSSKQPFVDVPVGAYYADAVQWAYEQGITNGTDASHFEPNRPITRAEFVTMLWRWSGNEPEIEQSPEPTRDIPKPPKVTPTIHPEYADVYRGRMFIGEDYSVGLYETLDQALVDMSDTAFIYKVHGETYMVGDHDYEGLWIIRYLQLGDTMRIEYTDGTVANAYIYFGNGTSQLDFKLPDDRAQGGFGLVDVENKALADKQAGIFEGVCQHVDASVCILLPGYARDS